MLTAVVNAALGGAVIAGAVRLVLRMTPRRRLNAATRYAVWWAALVVVACLPLVYLARGTARSAAPGSEPPAIRAAVAQPDISSGASMSAAVTAPRMNAQPRPRPALFPIEIPARVWAAPVEWGWLVLSLLMLGRLAAAYAALRHGIAHAVPPPPLFAGRAELWLRQCALRGSGSRRVPHVRVAASSDIVVPTVCGLRRPLILIPAQFFTELNERELDHVGMHEAAHIVRCDAAALVIERLIQALFALNPVVHWITRQMDTEREIACDDLVVGATGQAREYASCLARVVELAGDIRTSAAAPAAAGHASAFSTRVRLLLDRGRSSQTRLVRAPLAAAVAMLALSAWAGTRTPEAVVLTGAPAEQVSLLPVTVRDSGGRFMTGLKQTNFRLKRDGIQRDIALFADTEAPLSLAIVFDVARDAYVESARRTLMQSMELTNQGSEFVVVGPHTIAEPATGFTTDGVALLSALRAVSGGARSGLLEAIGVASARMRSARNAHRAILVISDGGPGAYTANVGMTAPILFAIGLPDTSTASSAAAPPCPEAAAQIAEQHGGVCLGGRGPAELRSVILKIVTQLNNQYVLGYAAEAGGRIDVELLVPSSLPKLDASFGKPYSVSAAGLRNPKSE